MRGHALHTFLVALPSLARRSAVRGAAPLEGEIATAPHQVCLPAPLEVSAPGKTDEARTDVAVRRSAARPSHRLPSGGYQVHNGRARRGAARG